MSISLNKESIGQDKYTAKYRTDSIFAMKVTDRLFNVYIINNNVYFYFYKRFADF